MTRLFFKKFKKDDPRSASHSRTQTIFLLTAVLVAGFQARAQADDFTCSTKVNPEALKASTVQFWSRLPGGEVAPSTTEKQKFFRCCTGKPDLNPANKSQWCNAGFKEGDDGLHRNFYTDELVAKKVDVAYQTPGQAACDSGSELYTCWPRLRPYQPIKPGTALEKCDYIDDRPLMQAWQDGYAGESFGKYDLINSTVKGSSRLTYPVNCPGVPTKTICVARAKCHVSKKIDDQTTIAFDTDITVACKGNAQGCYQSAIDCARDTDVSPGRGSDLPISMPALDKGVRVQDGG